MGPIFGDPYSDGDDGVLRTRLGLRTPEEIADAEADLTFARLVDLPRLRPDPIRPTGDLAELRAIHRHLFQDLYDWAGHLRKVDLRKPGSRPFQPVTRLRRHARSVFKELREDGYLVGLSRDAFVERLVHHYDRLNHLHPFRDGNGRTQRAFWDRIATDAGWVLDWTRVSGAVNDEACRVAGNTGDLAPMRAMLDVVVTSH